jgi:hypothetical protein
MAKDGKQAKRAKKAKKGEPAAPPEHRLVVEDDHDGGLAATALSFVLPVSLLAGGLVAYQSLSDAAEGKGDLMGAITLFLVATLVAMIGFGIVALLFVSFAASGEDDHDGDADDGDSNGFTGSDDRAVRSAGRPRSDALDGDGPVPTVALAPEPDMHGDAIDTALAPTDALIHDAH